MNNLTKISCPNCGTPIEIKDILLKEVELELNSKYQEQLERSQTEYQTQLNEERKKIRESVKNDFKTTYDSQYETMQTELEEKSKELMEFHKIKADLSKLKREKDELKNQLEAEAEIRIVETLEIELIRIRDVEKSKWELELAKMKKQLEDQKNLTEEMRRKQEQGSIQLQGEIQELAIEDWLESRYPLDNILEVKKGVRGADCMQIVNTYTAKNCGTIYYESKRTKNFDEKWISKFKQDMNDKGAQIGVLVTATMPKDMERMGLKEGVWVCTFDEFKGLSAVLRESVIQVDNVLKSQENKGDKMQMLYDYLTNDQFKRRIETIVDGFSQMKRDLDKEQNAIRSIWKARELQLEKVTINTIDMYGAIKGIAGNSLPSVNSLELEALNEQPEYE